MKFKLKLPNCRKYVVVVDNSESPTLESLKQATADELEKLGISGYHFDFSLNGKEIVRGDATVNIKDLGIVPGDILHVLFEDVAPIQELLAGISATPASAPARVPASIHTVESNTVNPEVANRTMAEQLASTSQAYHETPINETVDGEQAIDRVIVNRYLNEPILCRESSSTSVPEILRQSYQLSEVQTLNEAMVVVLHVLMLESGFVPQDVDRADALPVPATAKLGHIYRIAYIHTSCPEQIAVFTCIPVGCILSINANAGTSTFQMSLKPSLYVRRSQLNATNVASVYENIPKLSHLFKDNIVYPLLAILQTEEGITPNGIMSMATEVKLLIFSFLDVRSLINSSEVCKEFQLLTDDPALWKRLCFTDFPDNMSQRFITESSTSWKEKYKILYEQMQRRLATMHSFLHMPPPYAPFSPYAPPGFHGMFPGSGPYNPFQPIGPSGIIGGDYDRIPGGISTLIPNRGPFGPPPPPYRRNDVNPFLPTFLPGQRMPTWPRLRHRFDEYE